MKICGIDPGLNISGYAVLELQGPDTVINDAGIWRTDPTAFLAQRLAQIDQDFSGVLEQWQPDVLGVEQLFSHYRHPRTAILMGHARGVILATAARFGVPVQSFSATQVKRNLTGNGRASKIQIQRTIQTSLGLSSLPEPDDVADALAVALCCAQMIRREQLEAANR